MSQPAQDEHRALSERVNWDLLQRLAEKPHKHLNITEDARYGLMVDGKFDTANNGVGEVMQEARTVQHLLDMAGVPEGWGDSAHIDARVFLLLSDLLAARERLARIASWHSLETGPGGMVGLYCIECGNAHPCETRRMADGTHEDVAALPADVVDPAAHDSRVRAQVWDEARQVVEAVDFAASDALLSAAMRGFKEEVVSRLHVAEALSRITQEHAAAPSVRHEDSTVGDSGTPDPQRFWWHHDTLLPFDTGEVPCAPTPGDGVVPLSACVGCGCRHLRWRRGEPITEHPEPQEER